MPVTTAGELCEATLKKIGVLAAGETISSEDQADALDGLNELIDSWKAQRLAIFTITRTTFTIVSGTSTYSVGSGATVNVARPVFVESVKYQDTAVSPVLEYDLEPLTDDAYSQIAQKTLTNTLPTSFYWNPTYPSGTLIFWPVPTSTTLQGVFYAPAALAELATVATALSLPPGYRRALISNLAVDLSSDYRVAISDDLREEARESIRVIKAANERLMDMAVDAAALPYSMRLGWNIKIGR